MTRTHSTPLLRLAVMAVLPFTAVDSLPGGAEVCTPEASYDGSLLHYAICNVPDLDPRREDDAFVSGLPNGGSMYCVRRRP